MGRADIDQSRHSRPGVDRVNTNELPATTQPLRLPRILVPDGPDRAARSRMGQHIKLVLLALACGGGVTLLMFAAAAYTN